MSDMSSSNTFAPQDGVDEDVVDIKVCSYSTDPTKAWRKLHSSLVINAVNPLPPNTPIREDAVRFVCISDTHTKLESLSENPNKHVAHITVPDGDVLLHAGDFTLTGMAGRVVQFNKFMGSLPHPHKIVIAGNHELSFDETIQDRLSGFLLSHNASVLREMDVSTAKDLLTNCVYLEDSGLELYGFKIYGSPWQPAFREWAFNLPRGQPILDKWNQIPSNTDVLLTHGPPLGYGDSLNSGGRVGCVDLLNTVQKRVRPFYHIFGHIHEDYGIWSDGCTTYINASTCNTKYKPINPAIIFDLPLKDGYSRQGKFIQPN